MGLNHMGAERSPRTILLSRRCRWIHWHSRIRSTHDRIHSLRILFLHGHLRYKAIRLQPTIPYFPKRSSPIIRFAPCLDRPCGCYGINVWAISISDDCPRCIDSSKGCRSSAFQMNSSRVPSALRQNSASNRPELIQRCVQVSATKESPLILVSWYNAVRTLNGNTI